ncbi:MAG: NTP transferase domain-containing protein [Candidatus Paceibacterota bacterium]|jgi:bifunctional UDP-N-acetylglucosamine pyrophosphorylase/glucosamine-1-phosphate N-acetyltransferase
MSKYDKVKIIILAAGKGKRMQSELPKALIPLGGKPMIRYILDKVETLSSDMPYIVVGYNKEQIIKQLGDNYHYVIQEEQLGTGHAVNAVKNYTKDAIGSVVVLYGDQPFTSAETIKRLIEKQNNTKTKIVMATVPIPDFENWRIGLISFGRIIRGKDGHVKRIVEFKDANEEEKNIKELNSGIYAFDAKWLWNNIEKLKNENAQKEYYLTDLIKMATEEGTEIESIEIDAKEALGANTKEELKILENLLNKNS